MPETPRLGLNTYEQGDEGWDHTDTVEAVDETAIEHGPIAERPGQGDYDDELYHATDQGITWRWDAGESDWEYFSGQGSESQPVPGTTHLEAVSTDGIQIADKAVGFVEESVEEKNVGTDTSEVSFDVSQSAYSYKLRFDLNIGDSEIVNIRIAEDNNGDHYYWDQSGTKIEGEDHIELFGQNNGFVSYRGDLLIYPRNDMAYNGIGVINQVTPLRPDRVDNYLDKGGRTEINDPEEITVFTEGDEIRDGSTFELIEVHPV